MKRDYKILSILIILTLMVSVLTACSGKEAVSTEANVNINLEEKAVDIVAKEYFEGNKEDLHTTTLSSGMILVEAAVDMGSGLPTVIDGYIVDDNEIVASMWDVNGQYSQEFDSLLDEFGEYNNLGEIDQDGTADNYVDYMAMLISQMTNEQLQQSTYNFLSENYDMFFSPYRDLDTAKSIAQPVLINDILKNITKYNDTLFKTTMEIIEIEEHYLDNGDMLTSAAGFITNAQMQATYIQVLMIGETNDNVRIGTKVNLYGVPVSKYKGADGSNVIIVVALNMHHQLDGIIN